MLYSNMHDTETALQEIWHYQKFTELLIKTVFFIRLIWEICMNDDQIWVNNVHWQRSAIQALQEAAETFLVTYLEDETQLFSHWWQLIFWQSTDTNLCVIYAKQITIQMKNMTLVHKFYNCLTSFELMQDSAQ